MELSALIRQVQADMERGDYKTAARLCEHALVHAPSCVTAHRLLGECRLEMHDVDAAIEHFQTALNFDPMSVVVRLGMGVAAEERHDIEAAYACYLHAWEINPGLDDVRDRLVLLRRARGVEPRLHLTRAGLASVHLRAGRIDRAISELRALAEAEPQARQARSGLVAALWRGGEDASAAALCRGGLDRAPENGRYLAVLAEIEHRLQKPEAANTLARLHAIDPFGEIATVMADWRPDRDVSVLFADEMAVPEPVLIDEAAPFRAGTARLIMPPAVGEPRETLNSSEGMRIETAVAVGVGCAVAGLDVSIQPFVWEEFPSAPRSSPEPVAGWDDWHNPTPVAAARSTAGPSSDSIAANTLPSFEISDGVIDLAAGWDDLGQALADATPPLGADDRFSDLLAELRLDGLAPFDVSDESIDESAWEPLFSGDDAPVVRAVVPAPAEVLPMNLTAGAEATESDFSAAAIRQLSVSSPRADEFDGLLPFAFDDAETPVVSAPESCFDFSDLDVGTIAPFRSERVSMPLNGAGAVVATAETFPDRSGAIAASASRASVAPARTESPVSIFDVLRASKTRGSARGVAPAPFAAPTSVFHVEHSAAPATNQRRVAIDRDELMRLRIQLIEEEHSAGEIARTLEAKMSDGGGDPLAARILGEAYLRLGKSDQAAAQFRQAMLSGRAGRNLLGSAAR